MEWTPSWLLGISLTKSPLSWLTLNSQIRWPIRPTDLFYRWVKPSFRNSSPQGEIPAKISLWPIWRCMSREPLFSSGIGWENAKREYSRRSATIKTILEATLLTSYWTFRMVSCILAIPSLLKKSTLRPHKLIQTLPISSNLSLEWI